MSSSKKLLQAAAGNAGESLYAEEVFSTYLYTGTGSSLPIVNGIDLADSGGLVWTKRRTSANSNWFLDSERGGTQIIRSNTTEGQFTSAGLEITSFNSDGYTLGTAADINSTSQDDASWTFRKAEKFFDIQTFTAESDQFVTVNHDLDCDIGAVVYKEISGTDNWYFWHKSFSENDIIRLNTTAAKQSGQGYISQQTSSSAKFYTAANTTSTYVAYFFGGDAGGFGDDGSENIIKCGSYTGNNASTANVIDVGFEPQWLMIKGTARACNWIIADVMRGASAAPSTSFLEANTSDAEATSTSGFALVHPTATGFSIPSGVSGQVNEFNENYIYIAIRRPMKTPESGTEVFAVDDRAAATPSFVSDFPVDLYWTRAKTGGNFFDYARLRGDKYLQHDGTNAETDGGAFFDSNTGVGSSGSASTNNLAWMFKRATGFFDVVAYTGDGINARQITHNLKAEPELIISKKRSATSDWIVYAKNNGIAQNAQAILNGNNSFGWYSGLYPSPYATDSVYYIASNSAINQSGQTYISYLFATVAGVSKVGSYTGTGSNVDVDCGFSAGARLILIKRTDSTGDWYVYDYFRGIVSGNDPYLLLNTGTAEVTNTDYIDPLSSGFTVTSSAPAALNASGGTYIFLAIA